MSASGYTPRVTRASSRAASQHSNPVETPGPRPAEELPLVAHGQSPRTYGIRHVAQLSTGLDADGQLANFTRVLDSTLTGAAQRDDARSGTGSSGRSGSRTSESSSTANYRARARNQTSQRAETILEDSEPDDRWQPFPISAAPREVTTSFNTELSGFRQGYQPIHLTGEPLVVGQSPQEEFTLTQWKLFKQYILRAWKSIPAAWAILAIIFLVIFGMLSWHHYKINSVTPVDTTIIGSHLDVEQYDGRIVTVESRVERLEERLDAQIDSMETQIRDSIITHGLGITENAPRYRAVNFFSTGLGAVIDPYLTSPTMYPPSTYMQDFANRLFFLGRPNPNPPVAALEGWEDIGDCWCSAHSRDGKAQLAVLMPRTIYPTHITVEHIPATATLDVGAAPIAMELWVEIYDDQTREQISSGLAPLDDIYESLQPRKSLGPSFVRIATWMYDVYAASSVQTFPMQVDMRSFNAGVRRVVVRANSNNGRAGYTCLYRLRMHGELVQ